MRNAEATQFKPYRRGENARFAEKRDRFRERIAGIPAWQNLTRGRRVSVWVVCYYQRRESVSRRILQMAYVIAEPCIGTKDTACVDACPVDCIHPKKDEDGFAESDQLFIDPVECIDCGACVPACPVSAIFALDDLPEKWAHFTEKNAAHFAGKQLFASFQI